MYRVGRMRGSWTIGVAALLSAVSLARPAASDSQPFLQKYCLECHDAETKKGGLDLTALKWNPANLTNFNTWVLVHDRVGGGEMPPKKKPRPEPADLETFIESLRASLTAADQTRVASEGRTT